MKLKQTALWDEDEYEEFIFPENNLVRNNDTVEQDESSD